MAFSIFMQKELFMVIYMERVLVYLMLNLFLCSCTRKTKLQWMKMFD